MIGATIDQFKVIEVLGQTVVGDVFLAEHTQAGGRYVLHAIKPELTGNPEFKQKLMADIVQLIKIEHPNIVSPTNLLEVQGKYYLVSEYEDGRTLREMLNSQGGKLAIDGVLRIFKDILRGFGYAHNEGLVHCLLTPDSIIVTSDGEAKITGFGTILPREKERRSSEQEKANFARYFSPERFNFPETTDVRVNIYALGCILFEMVTARPPFSPATVFELEMAHSQDVIDDPKSLVPALPQGVSDAIMKAVAKKPEERFQTALEFYKEIEHVENMRRSELFEDDFVKGFGEISGLGESSVVVDSEDSSASFNLGGDDADFGFELPDESNAPDLQGETVRDDSISPDMFKMPDAGDPPPAEKAAAGPEDWEKAFEDSMGLATPQSPAAPSEFDFGGDSAEDEFDFGNLDADAGFGDLETPSDPDPAVPSGQPSKTEFKHPSDFAFDDMGESIELEDFGQGEAPSPSDGAAPAGPAASPASQFAFESDDGAFSFEQEEPDYAHASEDALPEVRRAQDGLEQSLKAADRTFTKTITVRRTDRRMWFVVAAIVILAGVIGFWWFRGMQLDKKFRARTQTIQTMINQNRFDDAERELNDALAESPPSDFRSDFERMKSQLEQSRSQIASQVESLFSRARDFERAGNFLTDGKADALGTYSKIVELDPDNEEAHRALEEIKRGQLSRANELIADDQEVEALRVYDAMRTVLPESADVETLYTDLRAKLVKEKSGTLKTEINQRISEKDYDAVPKLFAQLRDIEPNTDFLKQTGAALVETFNQIAEDAQARQDYDKAMRFYQHSLVIDPQNSKAGAVIDDLKEEALRYKIEKTQDELETATLEKNYKQMNQLARTLGELDPGNLAAGNALIAVNDFVAKLLREADQQRDLGQFKKAAQVYREIFETRGDPSARELWRKYEGFAPPAGMSLVPGSRFKMGYMPDPLSRPSHNVTVNSFFIDSHEVTNAEYKRFVDSNPAWRPGAVSNEYQDGNYLRHWENGAPRPGQENRPVSFVSWYAARAYAKWVNKRLPTEAEWELAASGGTSGQKYWWGNYSDADKAIYEFYPPKRPADVGSFPANGYGLYEILGNVSEWVEDSYSAGFYAEAEDAIDPLNTGPGPRIHRGGSYKSRGREVTIYKRFREDPRACLPDVGFRCARIAKID